MTDIKSDAIVKKYESEGSLALKEAKEYQIDNQKNFSDSIPVLNGLKEKIKQIEDDRKAITDPINEGLRNFNARVKEIKTPYEQARDILSSKQGDWQRSEEIRIRKLEEEAERKRKEKEEKEKAKLEAKAKKAEESGSIETAEQLREQADSFIQPGQVTETFRQSHESNGAKITGVAKIEIVSLNVLKIINGIESGKMTRLVELLLETDKSPLPQPIQNKIKKFMESKFGKVDASFNGIVVKRSFGMRSR